MKAMPHEAAEESPIEAALSRTGFPLNRSASFMRAPCNSSGNAIGPACQSRAQRANHFRLTGYKPSNTEKLSASQSRDRMIGRYAVRKEARCLSSTVAGATGFHFSAKKISLKILRGFVKRVCAAPWSVHGLRAIDRNRTVPAQCGARGGIINRKCAALSQAWSLITLLFNCSSVSQQNLLCVVTRLCV
jgi:hypothetical protein